MKHSKNIRIKGVLLISLFAVWTVLLQTVDVRPAGETAAEVGFAALNAWFHELTGVHRTLYHITDWLGLVPVFVCMLFSCVGLHQLITRKSLIKTDLDLILLGIYYILVIAFYLAFEMHPINYRPVFIDGRLEASYPSSTTLLVLSVMPTLNFQTERRLKNPRIRKTLCLLSSVFTLFMTVSRALSGVHWITDIIGAVLLSTGLYCIYKSAVLLIFAKNTHRR